MKKSTLCLVSLLGASALALSTVLCSGRILHTPPRDYANSWSEEDHAALPFRAGVNISGLEGEWYFRHAMRILLQPKTYTNIRAQGFDRICAATPAGSSMRWFQWTRPSLWASRNSDVVTAIFVTDAMSKSVDSVVPSRHHRKCVPVLSPTANAA